MNLRIILLFLFIVVVQIQLVLRVSPSQTTVLVGGSNQKWEG